MANALIFSAVAIAFQTSVSRPLKSLTSWPSRHKNYSVSLAMTTIESASEIHSNADSSELDTSTSDMSVNRDQLPEDSPVFFLEEARQAFRDRLPPFVVKKRSQVRRKCVIPTVNGTRPTYPTTIEVVPRQWDKNHVYWTIDLNHKRYIVTALSGGKLGGAKWVAWAGLENGFNEEPLALSQLASTHPPPSTSTADSLLSESALLPNNNPSKVTFQADKRRRHTSTTVSSRPSDQENNDPLITNAGLLTKNALSKGKKPTRHSELPARTSHNLSQGREETSKRRKLDISPREIRRLQAILPPSFREPNRRTSRAQIPAPQTQSTVTAVQLPASTSTGLFSNLFNQDPPNLISQSSQLSGSDHATPRPLNEPIVGNQDKLNRTTLIVRVAPSTEYTPLKLNECSSMSIFFSKAIGVWNLAEQDVAKIKVVFKWKHVDDPMRVMVMSHDQACFAYMLEEVEDAPVWSDEKGKCLLDVEIVMKHSTNS